VNSEELEKVRAFLDDRRQPGKPNLRRANDSLPSTAAVRGCAGDGGRADASLPRMGSGPSSPGRSGGRSSYTLLSLAEPCDGGGAAAQTARTRSDKVRVPGGRGRGRGGGAVECGQASKEVGRRAHTQHARPPGSVPLPARGSRAAGCVGSEADKGKAVQSLPRLGPRHGKNSSSPAVVLIPTADDAPPLPSASMGRGNGT
jgi:hypothetical protein